MARRLGLLGLFVFAFSALLFPAPANLGLLVIFVVALSHGPDFLAWLRNTPAAWPAFGFTLYVLARGALEIAVGDLAAGEAWKPISGWALLGMAPFVAYWCAGREDFARILLALCLLGMLAQALRSMDADALHRIVAVRREHFGLRLLGAPLYASIALLGLIVFRRRIGQWLRRWAGQPWRALFWLLLVLAFAYLLLMFILPQSRSSWLAALIAFPLTGLGVLMSQPRRSPRTLLRRLAATALGLVLVAVVLAPFVGETVVRRIGSESTVWSAMVDGRWDEVPYTSIGRRFHMTANGLGWFAEAPVFGIGPGGVEPRLRALDKLSIHEDLHNTYLDLAVETGAVGLLLLMGFLGWSYVALARAFAAGRVSNDMFWFLTGAAVIYMIVAAMNTRLINVDGQFTWLLLTGIILGLAAPPRVGAVAEVGVRPPGGAQADSTKTVPDP